jgi:hypothetical protein
MTSPQALQGDQHSASNSTGMNLDNNFLVNFFSYSHFASVLGKILHTPDGTGPASILYDSLLHSKPCSLQGYCGKNIKIHDKADAIGKIIIQVLLRMGIIKHVASVFHIWNAVFDY